MNEKIDDKNKIKKNYNNGNRLNGDVFIITPLSWQLITYFLMIMLILCFMFLTFGQYRRTEMATGLIVPDKGIVSIMPSRYGVVSTIQVIDGQFVEKGDPLVSIEVHEYLSNGNTASEEMRRSIQSQITFLDQRRESLIKLHEARIIEKFELETTLKLEIEFLEEQLAYKTRIVDIASKNYIRLRDISEGGLISLADVRQKEEELLSKQLDLTQTKQAWSSKKYQLNQAKEDPLQLTAQHDAELAMLASNRSQIEQQLSIADSNSAYVLQAPTDGIVTGIVGRIGQPARTNIGVMSIIPSNSVLQAEIDVPTSSIGFVDIGQTVSLAIDTFPYQRFGTIDARIISISKSIINSSASASQPNETYKLIAELNAFDIYAYGKEQPLLPGMTFVARITTAQQSLFEWLFEPIFAVARR